MRYLILMLLPIFLASCSSAVQMEDAEYEGRPHILVKTRSLDYYYDIRGGGFSRIVDREGNDWVSFKMEPWGSYPASAASSFRGLPNLVFQGEDDGAGHPGHDKCRSWREGHRILTESLSGKWRWSWDFFKDHAVLEVLKTDSDRKYWFLYEGTPGGRYQARESYFGSDLGGPLPGGHDYYKGDIFWGHFQWIYAGVENSPGCFFMVQKQKDNLRDMISFLGNTEAGLESPDGMCVFGFGREKEAKAMLSGQQSFVIGLYPERIVNQAGHQQLRNYLEANFLK